jgi:hypothetical protein
MAIWPWALGRKSISPRISRFSSDCFERIALRRQCRQPLVRIKEPNCPILASANHASTNEIRIGQRQALFFEVPDEKSKMREFFLLVPDMGTLL